MAQQNPPRNAVANIVSTDLANTVNIHDSENGSDIIVKSRRRPYCIATPPNIPPNSAPTTKLDLNYYCDYLKRLKAFITFIMTKWERVDD